MQKSFNAESRIRPSKEDIIGLGEDSFRKNYYAELQEKISDLERIITRNNALITTIPDILLVSTPDGQISPFANSSNSSLAAGILQCDTIVQTMREGIKKVFQTRNMATYDFSIDLQKQTYYLEARIHISEIDEILIIIRDMTERTLLEHKLRDAAEKDKLTSLYNRHYFEEQLAIFHQKSHSNLAILFIDIDGLKFINDSLGHPYGDHIIITVSRLINGFFSRIGYVARVGGDEFGVILSGLNQKQIEEKLVEFKESIDHFNDQSTERITISLSSGYSFHAEGIANVRWMYQEADNNMYQNKLLKESSTHSNLVRALLKTMEAKDYISQGHAIRMELLCIKMGAALKLPQKQMDRIKLLARFHDVGKVGIPDNILKKATKLTDAEWKVMKTHSEIGMRIAESSSELRDIALLIYHHHERWDGTGYPAGIKETAIPIECRILSIVDAYDAMTNDRPYRTALSKLQAVHEIYSCTGTQFDESLVKVFSKVINL